LNEIIVHTLVGDIKRFSRPSPL